ncbi:cyclic peptide export ABC transporter [Pyxidicoccus parkwayensis]|uniref:Cyclic peptide export ABC transporter n=1 Tax=Pyxidicoccus parkwayensis TaxID=2813578 RepID=A0ABX7P1H0_9BACT|nr:cyclic peptide export ABC transporter [Pyxidicoccus parkwaysis]QSQ23761.1 cyclic peptide export ABC transporter [Pyxidicoccus parkwaysis]
MKLLAFFLRGGSKWSFLLPVLCGVLSGAASTGLISLINSVLERSVAPDTATALRFAGIGLVALLARVCSQLLLNYLQQSMLEKLRMELVQRILATPLRELEETGSPRLLAMLTDDVNNISSSLLVIPQILINAAIVTGCLVYLAWLSPNVFLALMAFTVVGFVTYQLPMSRGLGFIRASREVQDRLYKHLGAVIQGIKELKLHPDRRSAFLEQSLGETTTALRRLNLKGSSLFSAASSWGMFLFFVFIGLMLFVLPAPGAQNGAASLVSYTLTVLYLQQPLDALLANIPFLSRGMVSLRKVERLLALDKGLLEAVRTAPAPRTSFTRLELVGITHSYHREREDSSFTLGPIHLKLEKGELVFLVGGNGSGKTTLAKLITGLYTPESGEVRLDGVSITAENREELRQCFSTVFSDYYLFSTLLGLTPAGLVPRARQYLERLHLNHKVKIDDDGTLSTTDLSQGQRKRLALLTAWLEDRPLYVFDEWGADQDPSFKAVFYEELLPEMKRAGKTVLVISHDNRYFHVADRLLHLEFGKLVSEAEQPPLEARQRAS